ncbi:MAG: translocation/assembly module TamB domain-containing protein [Candidatus Krumholzibacteria bacterium]|jgi:hypothetical protein|nr:translocation/assembly module TamB domain-containing protein [Candidatus Krumholzibacteria bacterium]
MDRTRGTDQTARKNSRRQNPRRAGRRSWHRARRLLRRLMLATAALLLLIAIVLAAAPGRKLVLRAGFAVAERALPGELRAQRAAWPQAGSLALDRLVWTDGPDTLARIESVRLQIRLSDLWQRDLTVVRAEVAGVAVDLPAIQARLPATATDKTAAESATPAAAPGEPTPRRFGVPWLRAGRLPLLPSMAVERLSLARVALEFAPGQTARLDSLAVACDLQRDHPLQLATYLQARPSPALGVSWRWRGAAIADTLEFAVAPLHLAAPQRLPAARVLPLDGRVRLPLSLIDSLLTGAAIWPTASITDLLIDGDAGAWRLDANIDGRTRGRVRLQSELPEAPVALLAALAQLAGDTTLTAARLANLAARWSEHGPPGVDLTIDAEPPPPGMPFARAQLAASGTFRLPAPAAVAPLLPTQLAVGDLGPLLLDLDARYDGAVEPAGFEAMLDLGRTAWIEQAELRFDGDAGAVRAAALTLRLPGLDLVGEGRADRDSLRLDLTLELPDASLVRRWRDPATADLDFDAALQLRAAGPWSKPRARLHGSLRMASPQLEVPAAQLAVIADTDTLDVRIGLPSGLRSAAFDLARLEFGFGGTAGDSLRWLRGRVDLAAAAPPAAIAVGGQLTARDLDAAPALEFAGEHLSLALGRRSLANTGPWHAAFNAAASTVCLTELQLAGELGHLDLDGCARPDSIAANVDLDLRLNLDEIRPLLPTEQQTRWPAGTLTAAGRLAAAGIAAAPWVGGGLRLAVADQPDLAGLGVDLGLSVAGRGPVPATLDPGRLGWQTGSARFTCRLLDRQTALAALAVRVPGPLTAAVPDSLDARLDVPALDLTRLVPVLAPLLPPDHAAAGIVTVHAHVHGPLPAALGEKTEQQPLDLARDLDLAIAAELRLDDIAVVLADGSALQASGTVEIAGTTGAPLGRGNLDVSGDLGRLQLRADAQLDSMAVAADLDLRVASQVLRPYLPVEQQILLPQGVVTVAGPVRAAGRPDAPWTVADLTFGVADRPELAAFTSRARLHVGGSGAVPAHLNPSLSAWRPRGLHLHLQLLDGGAELLRLTTVAPLPRLAAGADSVDVRLDAAGLDLARLSPFLPAGVGLAGRFTAATRMAGLIEPGRTEPDLDLSGRLALAGFRIELPEGSRLAMHGEVNLAGTSHAPVIRGGMRVEGGLLRLPDPPPVLLPAAGDALLWHGAAPAAAAAPNGPVAAAVAAAADTTVGSAHRRAGEAGEAAVAEPAASALPSSLPDLVFSVTSPGGLWLRGQGLDVELAGDLALLLRGGRIAVEGELQAVQGTMRQLGHLFRLERGRVVFDGSETELNPELDLSLGVRVGQYAIGILLGGTATAPTLRFTSDPELSEGDILGTLLFGKPLDELDEGQSGLLASRAAQIAAAYGSTRLQESLARQLGVDVVSLAPREGDEETTALTVGKYLSPRVMLRYEQLLREGSAFFVHLDYAFAGAFRLHTQVSQGEESGVQLKWLRDW